MSNGVSWVLLLILGTSVEWLLVLLQGGGVEQLCATGALLVLLLLALPLEARDDRDDEAWREKLEREWHDLIGRRR